MTGPAGTEGLTGKEEARVFPASRPNMQVVEHHACAATRGCAGDERRRCSRRQERARWRNGWGVRMAVRPVGDDEEDSNYKLGTSSIPPDRTNGRTHARASCKEDLR